LRWPATCASLHGDHTEAVRAFVEKRAPNFGKK
jgi:hypothetical protein